MLLMYCHMGTTPSLSTSLLALGRGGGGVGAL
jgi:hypothetical protein